MTLANIAIKARETDVFAEIDPNHKEQIILALKRDRNIVGYMGDGINDAPAIHAADVGISVNTASDTAKDAASIVLLEKDLNVLIDGIKEGRRTFANTLKYIFIAMSANFGNMFSMAGASLFLKFLPLLPKQILIINLLTDFPALQITDDAVDEDWMQTPIKWDMKFIKKFIFIFGLISSVFDYLTFFVLLKVFNASEVMFHSGWFVESVLSATVAMLIVKSPKPFFKSKSSKKLILAVLIIDLIVLILPYTPIAQVLGFSGLPVNLLITLLLLVVVYGITLEVTKKFFYKHNSL